MALDADSGSPGAKSILIFVCTKTGISRTARPLRARGITVQVYSSWDSAVDHFRDGPVDLVVVERDETDNQALAFLRHLHDADFITPTVLVTPFNADTLAAAVNEARVTRVVSASDDLKNVLESILAVSQGGEAELPHVEILRARCAMLEQKIDTLVREGIQRDGAAHLLHDVLVEIGHASGLKEIAGRTLARLVTTLRLDMAMIVLATPHARTEQALFSFGCPRALLEELREVEWADVVDALGVDEAPRPLLGAIPEPLGARLSRAMQLEGLQGLVLFPLRARETTVGFVALGNRERRFPHPFHAAQLGPVVKQIAIALENSRLVETAAAAERFATSVLQHLLSTVVVTDASGRVVRCYDDKLALFRGKAISGVLLDELLPKHEAGVLQDQIAGVSGGGDPLSLRALHLTLPAGERLLNVSLAPLAGRDVMLLFDDITHRESIAGDLRRARALTSSLFAGAPAGILFLRHDSEIVDINSTACRILRSDRTQLLNKSLHLLYPDLWRAMTLEASGGRGEVTFPLRGEDRATVSFSMTRLGRPGAPAGVLLQIQDMGELQTLREEVRRKDSLALMGQMVSFVAHEIKNPLFGISSTAQVLAREVGTTESNRLAGVMLSEIDRLAQLLEDLLVFGNKRAIATSPGDPTEVCHEIAAMHAEALTQRGVALDLDLEPPVAPVAFDPARLRQVVMNLVANAIDATPKGGTISLGTRSEGGEYVIRVTNTGEPIPPADLPRIFDLFFTTKTSGTGLGLPICTKIIADHGGRIEVSSGSGQPTTFAIRIPAPQGGTVGDA